MPALITARARWEARQAKAYSDARTRARALLAIFTEFNEETFQRWEPRSLAQLLKALADLAAEGAEGDE
jgi:hypothetical protein